jgi:hypothetical protein
VCGDIRRSLYMVVFIDRQGKMHPVLFGRDM